jgi:hypothetical protein
MQFDPSQKLTHMTGPATFVIVASSSIHQFKRESRALCAAADRWAGMQSAFLLAKLFRMG